MCSAKTDMSNIFPKTDPKNMVINKIVIYRKAKLSLLYMLDADYYLRILPQPADKSPHR